MKQRVVSGHSSIDTLRFLSTERVRLDDRNTTDILAQAANIAQLFHFYDLDNELDGNWQAFLLKDKNILLSWIAKTPRRAEYERFNLLIQQLRDYLAFEHPYREIAKHQQAICYRFNALLSLVRDVVGNINKWLEALQLDFSQYQLKSYVLECVKGKIGKSLTDVLAIQENMAGYFPAIDAVDPQWKQDLNPQWCLDRISQTSLKAPINRAALLDLRFLALRPDVEHLMQFYLQVIVAAEQAVLPVNQAPDTRKIAENYPDTALLTAFANLLKPQQHSLNDLSRRHLDFYYQRVLGLTLKSASADHTWLLIKLKPAMKSYILASGTAFDGGSDVNNQPIIYESDYTQEINQIEIAQVETHCFNEHGQLIQQIITEPDVIKTGPDGKTLSWPLFGQVSPTGKPPAPAIPKPATLPVSTPSRPDQAASGSPSARSGATPAKQLPSKPLLQQPKPTTSDPIVQPQPNAAAPGEASTKELQQQEPPTEPPTAGSSPSDPSTASGGNDSSQTTNNMNHPAGQGNSPIANKQPPLQQMLGDPSTPGGPSSGNLQSPDNAPVTQTAPPKNTPVKKSPVASVRPLKPGWSFASPMFYLLSGNRVIHLSITFLKTVNLDDFLQGGFYLSTDKNWYQVWPQPMGANSGESKTLKASITLKAEDPPIVPFAKKKDGYKSEWPLFKVIPLLHDATLDGDNIETMEINVSVTDINAPSVYNESSKLSGDNFYPFGGQCPVGANFFIDATEMLAKPLSAFSMQMTWSNLPTSFASYFKAYRIFLDASTKPNDSAAKAMFQDKAFKVTFNVLEEGDWKPYNSQTAEGGSSSEAAKDRLFDTKSSPQAPTPSESLAAMFGSTEASQTSSAKMPSSVPPIDPTGMTTEGYQDYLLPDRTWSWSDKELSQITPSPRVLLKTQLPLSQNSFGGVIKMTLTDPLFGFGQSLYSQVLSFVSLDNAQRILIPIENQQIAASNQAAQQQQQQQIDSDSSPSLLDALPFYSDYQQAKVLSDVANGPQQQGAIQEFGTDLPGVIIPASLPGFR